KPADPAKVLATDWPGVRSVDPPRRGRRGAGEAPVVSSAAGSAAGNCGQAAACALAGRTAPPGSGAPASGSNPAGAGKTASTSASVIPRYRLARGDAATARACSAQGPLGRTQGA